MYSALTTTQRNATSQAANQAASAATFAFYTATRSTNTNQRQAQDLALFAQFLGNLPGWEDITAHALHTNPAAWQGVGFGLVQGFVGWMVGAGYAISSVNVRLSTIRSFAQNAALSGVISASDLALIKSVKGFSQSEARHLDEKRENTRMGNKKAVAVTITEAQAVTLKTAPNATPQGKRDSLLMCLLLDHGLRAGELAELSPACFDMAAGELRFTRPKTSTTTTHRLTRDTLLAAQAYLAITPGQLHEPLLLTSTRALRNGTGGELQAGQGMSRIVISQRVELLGRALGVLGLSAHDCRHFCATTMAKMDYNVRELCDWFGWASPAMALRYINSTDVQERYKG